jgi:hypothetical protein
MLLGLPTMIHLQQLLVLLQVCILKYLCLSLRRKVARKKTLFR